MNKHRKHANLTRREYGNMAPCEVAIVGTKCSVIKELVQEVALKLHQHFKLAYADASHSKNEAPPVPDQLTFHDSGILESTSDYHMNSYLDKIKFAGYDLVFMNGNHYPGARQVLLGDPAVGDAGASHLVADQEARGSPRRFQVAELEGDGDHAPFVRRTTPPGSRLSSRFG